MTRRWQSVLLALVLAVATHAALAQQVQNVGLNSAELIRLDRSPAIVLVANPEILDVVLEQNRLMFLLGKAVGQTRLFVLDAEGRSILTTDIVVTPGEERRVFVQRGVNERILVCNPRCAIESDAGSEEGAADASAADSSGASSAAAGGGATPPATGTQ